MDLPGASLLAPPPHRHALAVSTHAVRLSSIAANLRQRAHYDEVTTCTDPAAAMAELRRGHKFEVVVVDMYSLRYRAAPAFELLECAIDEMHVETYAVSEIGLRYGPIVMKDLNKIRKDIYNKASNGFKSPEAKPNGSCNNSSSVMTTPTTTTLLISGRRATRRRMSRTQVSDTNCQGELDGGNVKNEQQNPAEKPKKARLVWTDELHKKFVEAHDKLLPGDAVPKKILKLMNDSTLTRENIASHLQKHRMNIDPLRRGNPKTKHQKLTPPQAALSSPNLSQQQQQASPTMMHPLSSSNFSEIFTTQGVVYMNHNMNVQPMVKPPTNSDMQDNHSVMDMQSFKDSILLHTECVFPDLASKDMYTRDNKSKQNYTWYPDNSVDISEILDKDPKPSWDVKYLFSYGD